MDAASKLSHKTSLFFVTAALFAAPAFAQLQVSTNSVSLPSNGQTFANVSVTSGSGGAVPFTVAKGTGDTFYSVQALGLGSTPDTVQVTLLTSSFAAQNGSFTVTNTGNAADKQTVAVHYVPGGVGGGTGLITASPNPLNIPVALFGTNSANITLSTSNTTPVPFSIGTFTAPGNFITSVAATTFQVSSSASSILTVTVNAGSLTNGTYQGSIPIQPTGGTAFNIPVNLTVGTGTGSTTYQFGSGTSYNFAYPVGTQQAFTTVTSTNGAVTTFNATPSVNWLLANGQTQAFNQPVGSGLNITLSSAVALLPTGTFTGNITIQNPTNAADQTLLTVTLSVNQGTLPNLTASPTSFTINAPVGTVQTSSQISLSSPSATTITGITWNTTNGTGWLNANINSNTLPATLTATVFPSTLAAGTYNGTVTLTFSGGVNGSQTFPVTLTVGGGGGGGTVSGVGPTALSFYFQQGSNAFVPQQSISVSGSGSVSVGTIVISEATPWISATATGPAPSQVIVGVIPGGLSVGQHTATVPVITTSGTTNVTVTLTVTSGVVIYSNPGSVNVTDVSPNPSTQITLSASDNSALAFTVTSSASWVTLGTPTSTTTPASIFVNMNTAGLPAGVNTASISVAATGAADNPLVIPVVAIVTNGSSGGVLTLSSSSLTFNATAGGAAPPTQNLTVSAAFVTNFTVSTAVQNGGTNWLTVSPSGSQTTNTTLTVTANSAGLVAGTYNGTISLTANGVTQNVPVSLVVTGGSISVTPTTLVFNSSGTTSQSVTVTSTVSGVNAVSYNVSATTASGGSWLSVSATTGITPSQFTASVNSTGLSLATGTYQGTITVTPSSGAPVNIGVTLNVTALTVTASTANGTTLSFSFRVGDANPLGQSITVGGSQGASFSATAASTGNWLAVSPASGAAPSTVQATVNPSGLNPGTYNGTVTVAGTNGATGSTTINVSLAITAPLPTITSGGVTNAGSYVAGSISPGEIITIFGTALGPTTAAGLTLDSSGKVATTLAGVQVLINNFPAPLTFASDKQVSAVVPYELAPFVSASVIVKYLGQSSNGINVAVAATAPGVFSANSTGTGPAAAVDATQGPTSLNGPGNPAARGDVITMYLTGEGITSPAVTGRVTPGTTPFTLPLLAPTVLVDGVPATINFYGEAPLLTSGVLQINFVVPTAARSGEVSLVVRMGGVDSQPGITVSIR